MVDTHTEKAPPMIKRATLLAMLLIAPSAHANSIEKLQRDICNTVKGVTVNSFRDRENGLSKMEVLVNLDTPLLRRAARVAFDTELPEDEEEAQKLREGVARVVEFECLVDRGVL